MATTAAATGEFVREARPIGDDRERRLVIDKPIVPTNAESATMLPRAPGVGDEREARDADWVVQLGLLDRSVLGVVDMWLDAIHAVL